MTQQKIQMTHQCDDFLENDEGFMVCVDCGLVNTSPKLISDIPDHEIFVDYKNVRKKSVHKRPTYFDKKMDMLLARQKIFIPDKIMQMCRKVNPPTIEGIYEVLKTKETEKYLRHVFLIYYHITKIRFSFPEKLRAHLKILWCRASEVYYRQTLNKRKFMPFTFVIRKFLFFIRAHYNYKEHGYNPLDYLFMFPRLKTKKAQKHNEEIWEMIRHHIDYNFYVNNK